MATWQMRDTITRYKVIIADLPLSLRARLSRHLTLFPLRSEGGPASFLTQLRGSSPYSVCRAPGLGWFG